MVKSLSRRAFAAASLLSGIAGFIDGLGFIYLGGFFVSFMSGNSTRASVGVAGANLDIAGHALLLIGAFVGGAMAGTAVPGGRSRGETRVLLIVLLSLSGAATCGLAGWEWATGALLAFAMGSLNTVFARGGEATFGITYMTGALVKLAQNLVLALSGGARFGWVRYFTLWLSIGIGAISGATAYGAVGIIGLWAPVVVLTALLAVPQSRAWLRI